MTAETQDTPFIAFDWCGTFQQYGRFTHMHSGDTIVCPSDASQQRWDEIQLEFFRRYPGLTVHDCPGTYSMNGRLMGTTEEICERLQNRLQGVSNATK